jgi:hypothetical protein
VDGHEADLVALAVDADMTNAFPALQIPDTEPAELLAPDPVVKERSQDGAIADPFQCVLDRRRSRPEDSPVFRVRY